jgi:1-pyrroline-5-carboxylate dehydrogenase
MVIDPMDKSSHFIKSPLTSLQETEEFKSSMASCPRYGLHNPLKNPERYVMYGKII